MIYKNHAHELAEIEVQRAREELRQLQAEVLNTLANAKYDAARAGEAEAEIDADEKEAEYYARAIGSITNRV